MTTRHAGPLLGWIAALAVVDLATKRWAVATLSNGPHELPGPLDLQLSHNTGPAFGLFSNLSTFVISSITLAFIAVVFNMGRNNQAPSTAAILIVAGGVANVIDRLQAGSVVDMLHAGWWPTFNLADIYIVTGVAWWTITIVTAPKTSATPTDPRSASEGLQGGPIQDPR